MPGKKKKPKTYTWTLDELQALLDARKVKKFIKDQDKPKRFDFGHFAKPVLKNIILIKPEKMPVFPHYIHHVKSKRQG